METGRRIVAVLLGLVGLTALVSLEEIAFLFAGLSPDGTVHSYSWLQLELALAGLLGPAAVIFLWPTALSAFQRFGLFLSQLSLRHFLLATLAVGLLVRMVAILLFQAPLESDALEYDRLGWTLAETGCYCDDGLVTAYRAPGYPFFLSLIYRCLGHAPSAVLWLQIPLGLLTVLLSFGIARRLQFSESVARLTAVVVCLFPGLILYTGLLWSETVFVTLILGGIWLCLSVRPMSLFAGGLLLGIAALTRPMAVLLPIVLVAYWWLGNRSMRLVAIRLVVVAAGLILIVLPWMLRNQAALGRFTIATSGGVNFYIGNNPAASLGYQTPDPDLFDLTDPRNEAANDRSGYGLGLTYLVDHPLSTLKRAAGKAVYLFAYDADPLRYSLTRADYGPGLVLKGTAVCVQAIYLVVLLLAGRGIWQQRKDHPALAIPLGVLLVVIGVHVMYFSGGRFHVPTLPFLALLAAAGGSRDGTG